MTRAVLYARVSTKRQMDNTSIDGQIEAMEKYAEQQGYKVVERVKAAHSGSSADLPGIQRLLEIGHAGEANVVVVFRVDRFMRGDDADSDPGLDAAIVERLLNKTGLEVEYLDLPGKNSEGYVWIRTLKRITASIERKNINERMIAGRRRRVQEGNVLVHGRPPYGYREAKVDGKRTLVLCEEEARVVRLIFAWYVEGDGESGPLTMYEITKALTAQGVPTKGDKDPYRVKRSEYGKWCHSSVARILHRETYAGVWHYGKWDGQNPDDYLIPVAVPLIVSREVWLAAQERMRQNKAEALRNTKYLYLLRRRVTCDCGAKMNTIMTRNGRGGKGRGMHFYYMCPARRNPEYVQKCQRPFNFRADHVDSVVWEWVKSFLSDPQALAAGLQQEQANREKTNRPLRERLAVVDDLLAGNRQQLERALDLYISGDFPREMLTERKQRLEETINGLERERETLAARLEVQALTDEQLVGVTEFAQEVAQGLEKADSDFDARRRVIEILDVRATLTAENGQKVVYVQCMLGKDALSIVSPGS